MTADPVARASENALPEDSFESFKRHGFMVFRGALAPAEVNYNISLIDSLHDRLLSQEDFESRHMESPSSVRIRNAVGLEPRFASLLDHPNVFPSLVAALGIHLRLIGSEAFVRNAADDAMVAFHTDGGPAMQMLGLDHGGQALQLKVQYFLTDLSDDDSGNFMLIPGSHWSRPSQTLFGCFIPEANSYLERGEHPPAAIQLRARPGDAVMFPYSLWHAVAPNRSGRQRKSLILRYGQLWHQPFDYVASPNEALTSLTARQRRLLGDFGDSGGTSQSNIWYKPPNQAEVIAGQVP